MGSSEGVTKGIKGSNGRNTACASDSSDDVQTTQTNMQVPCQYISLLGSQGGSNLKLHPKRFLTSTYSTERYFRGSIPQIFWWNQCIRPDHIDKILKELSWCIAQCCFLCSWHLRSSWSSLSHCSSHASLELQVSLAPKLAGSPQSSGCELLLCVASARYRACISLSSAAPTQKLLFKYLPVTPFSNPCLML